MLSFSSCTLETEGAPQRVEVGDEALIETVESVTAIVGHTPIGGDGAQQTRGQGRVDAFEEFQEEHADAVAVRQEPIPPGCATTYGHNVRDRRR